MLSLQNLVIVKIPLTMTFCNNLLFSWRRRFLIGNGGTEEPLMLHHKQPETLVRKNPLITLWLALWHSGWFIIDKSLIDYIRNHMHLCVVLLARLPVYFIAHGKMALYIELLYNHNCCCNPKLIEIHINTLIEYTRQVAHLWCNDDYICNDVISIYVYMQGFCSTSMAVVWTIYLMTAATHSSWVRITPIARIRLWC